MNKVLCPWCGSEMQLEEALPFSRIYAYVCECGAVSPNESGKEQAYAAALHRTLQKPLTLEEAMEREIFWIENWTEIRPAVLNDVYSDKVYITVVHGDSECNVFNADRYGKGWRCWATKPTDAERKAAKWE